jgi:hypothetical protein
MPSVRSPPALPLVDYPCSSPMHPLVDYPPSSPLVSGSPTVINEAPASNSELAKTSTVQAITAIDDGVVEHQDHSEEPESTFL